MTKTIKTNAKNPDFMMLVKLLDEELAMNDGKDHAFYNQFNQLDMINHVVVVYQNDKPVGCGAMKQFDDKTMEIKRMFTDKNYRGQGIASTVLVALENWATELSFKNCVMETGLKQPEAMRLYKKSGYQSIPNYGQYIGMQNSQCFEKILRSKTTDNEK